MCSSGRAGYAKEVPEHFVVPALYAFSISSRASELSVRCLLFNISSADPVADTCGYTASLELC